jgi:hypothetical protein
VASGPEPSTAATAASCAVRPTSAGVPGLLHAARATNRIAERDSRNPGGRTRSHGRRAWRWSVPTTSMPSWGSRASWSRLLPPSASRPSSSAIPPVLGVEVWSSEPAPAAPPPPRSPSRPPGGAGSRWRSPARARAVELAGRRVRGPGARPRQRRWRSPAWDRPAVGHEERQLVAGARTFDGGVAGIHCAGGSGATARSAVRRCSGRIWVHLGDASRWSAAELAVCKARGARIRRAGPTVRVLQRPGGRAQVAGARAARLLATCCRKLGPAMLMRIACIARRLRIAAVRVASPR